MSLEGRSFFFFPLSSLYFRQLCSRTLFVVQMSNSHGNANQMQCTTNSFNPFSSLLMCLFSLFFSCFFLNKLFSVFVHSFLLPKCRRLFVEETLNKL